MNFKPVLFLPLFGLLSFSLFGQLQIDTSYSASELVDEILLGNGIRAGNVKVKGHRNGYAAFTIDTAIFGMHSGILLSNGSVFTAAGKNDSPFATGRIISTRKKSLGDRDLNKLCKGKTFDAVVIEFDFIPFENKVSFNYCFASEEYREFVNTSFNDVFGFFITGPGFKKQNTALIPGTSMPVAINNVNQEENKKYYSDNDPWMNFKSKGNNGAKPKYNRIRQFFFKLFHRKEIKQNGFALDKSHLKDLDSTRLMRIQYDGMTTKISMVIHLVPYKKYHMKIAIADVADAILDSGVFLEAGSFRAVKDSTVHNFKDYADQRHLFDHDSLFRSSHKTGISSTNDNADKTENRFEITDIHFASDSELLSDSSKKTLDDLAAYLLKNPKYHCELSGYTDNTGSEKRNKKLSEDRAKTVMEYLHSKGISKDKMEYSGHSSNAPVGDNNSEQGRLMNRRVEIELIEED